MFVFKQPCAVMKHLCYEGGSGLHILLSVTLGTGRVLTSWSLFARLLKVLAQLEETTEAYPSLHILLSTFIPVY
jgi:hypothetical protein